MSSPKKIVVIGGGAAGLELIARLARQYKKDASISITLIDNQLKHIWKPLFHEVAAGSFNDANSITDYISYAFQKGFEFQLGSIKKLDRQSKIVTVDAVQDEEKNVLLPEREIHYDILVIAIGSQANEFNIKGVKENCFLIDNLYDTEILNKRIINEIIKYQYNKLQKEIDITIVGGGATGVELSAELHHTLSKTLSHNKSDHNLYKITLLEAADRVLSNLPERISIAVTEYLREKGIKVLSDTKVIQVESDKVKISDGTEINSTLTIWVAGVKANPILSHLDGLEVNKVGQLIVNDKLQTTVDKAIFAIGDCSSCAQVGKEGKTYNVPARAQAAYQEALVLAKSIENMLKGKQLISFHYKDYGSLIALSSGTVGSLTSHLGKNIYVEGWLARFFYWLLYRKHLYVLHGFKYTTLKILRDLLSFIHKPEIKLH